MAGLFSILVDIAARTADFEAGMTRVEKRLDAFGDAIKKVGALTVAGFSVAEIAAFTESVLTMGQQLSKAAVQTNLSGTAISELAYAARTTGVPLESVTGAITKMEVALSQASTGSVKQAEAFQALGISLNDIKNLKPDQQFELIATQISKLTTVQDQDRAARDLFGRSFSELLPLLKSGADGIEKLREEARQLGESFSDDQLQNLKQSKESIDKMTESFKGLATMLIAKAAPAITAFFDLIRIENGAGGPLETATLKIKQLTNAMAAFGNNPAWRAQIAGIEAKQGIADIIAKATADMQSNVALAAPPGYDTQSIKDIDAINKKIMEGINARKAAAEESIRINGDWLESEKQRQDATQTDLEAETIAWSEFMRNLNLLFGEGGITVDEYYVRVHAALDKALTEVQVHASLVHPALLKVRDDAMDAAKNIQSAFADFLFDPFAHGVKGMLTGFLDAIRRMVANAAAQKIFSTLFSGSGGLGGVLAGALSGMGFAGGGSFTVPGSGAADTVPVSFMASPGERVTVGSGGGGAVINMPINIDARGATTDAVKLLPGAIDTAVNRAVAKISNMINRGQFAGL